MRSLAPVFACCRISFHSLVHTEGSMKFFWSPDVSNSFLSGVFARLDPSAYNAHTGTAVLHPSHPGLPRLQGAFLAVRNPSTGLSYTLSLQHCHWWYDYHFLGHWCLCPSLCCKLGKDDVCSLTSASPATSTAPRTLQVLHRYFNERMALTALSLVWV